MGRVTGPYEGYLELMLALPLPLASARKWLRSQIRGSLSRMRCRGTGASVSGNTGKYQSHGDSMKPVGVGTVVLCNDGRKWVVTSQVGPHEWVGHPLQDEG